MDDVPGATVDGRARPGHGQRGPAEHGRGAAGRPATTAERRRALFHVVRGDPSDAEVAALTVVLTAAASAGPPVRPAVRDRWSAPAARLRSPVRPGPDAWRTSTWPR